MITIDQLLESVDLEFEPRFVTKDENGEIFVWVDRPEIEDDVWDASLEIASKGFGAIKLAEFANTYWTKCIYEVPRKTTGKIERLERHIRVENGYEISCPPDEDEIIEKINLLIDAVNELKGAKNE